jgi:hypothetical protein
MAIAACAHPDSTRRRSASARGVPLGTTTTGRASRRRSTPGTRVATRACRIEAVAPCQTTRATNAASVTLMYVT